MHYSFDVQYAQKYGLEESIILNNLIFWIAKNKAGGKNYFDGHWWTYNSAKAFSRLFPFWDMRKIQRILSNLAEDGVLKKGNYNKTSYDRTNWYTIIDPEILQELDEINPSDEVNEFFVSEIEEAKEQKHANSIIKNCQMEKPDLSNGISKNDQPIPDINTDIKPNTKTNSEFEVFRVKYPGSKRGHDTELKELRKHKDWKNILPLLLPALEKQITAKDKSTGFVPNWKNLKTWIGQRCWEEEPVITYKEQSKGRTPDYLNL